MHLGVLRMEVSYNGKGSSIRERCVLAAAVDTGPLLKESAKLITKVLWSGERSICVVKERGRGYFMNVTLCSATGLH